MDFKEGEILYFDKPLYWTSFQVVNKVRYAISKHLGIKPKQIKVGHAGTLDPMATGVMVVCTGKATKKIESFQYQTKEYVATLKFGATTPSFDLETPIDKLYAVEHITKELLEKTLRQFLGEIEQVPPKFSAVKVDGKRAFDLARNNVVVDLKKKILRIEEIELLNFAMPTAEIRVVCSKGTYIRALVRDIGFALQSGAHLVGLRRTRVGEAKVENCIAITDFCKKYEVLIDEELEAGKRLSYLQKMNKTEQNKTSKNE